MKGATLPNDGWPTRAGEGRGERRTAIASRGMGGYAFTGPLLFKHNMGDSTRLLNPTHQERACGDAAVGVIESISPLLSQAARSSQEVVIPLS
jgi:hypothetical protein